LLRKKVLLGAGYGYLFALITSPIVPELVSLLIPFGGMAAGSYFDRNSNKVNIPEVVPESQVEPAVQEQPQSRPAERPRRQVHPEFEAVLEYLEVLEDMVISEGQKHNLDDEIVEKSLALFARLQRVIPLLEELNNGTINHTIRRLVLKDLNGFITPFLRLSGETKMKNRRTLLNGLKDVNMKITSIVETIEHKDLIELQTKADLIHSRYNESDQF